MIRAERFVDSIVRALPTDRRAFVRRELLDHLRTALQHARTQGLTDQAAAQLAMSSLGNPRRLGIRLWLADWGRTFEAARGPALVVLVGAIVLPYLAALR